MGIEEILTTVTYSLFWYFLAINLFYVLLITLAIPLIYNRFDEVRCERLETIVSSESLPSVSIIITLHNEGQQAVDAVNGVLNLSYPNLEVVAVNDESTNDTFDLLTKAFELKPAIPKGENILKHEEVKAVYRSPVYPNLVVLDKKSVGAKGDATNAGINEASCDLVAIIDADTILEKDAISRMIRPFYDNTNIVGEGGTLRIVNGCDLKNGRISAVGLPNNTWSGIQVAEYLRAFLYGRLGCNKLGGPLIISGAFGLFRKSAVIDVEGYEAGSMGEDFELTSRLNNKFLLQGKRPVIQFIPDPIAWTTVPETYESLKKQRVRWHQGLIEVLWKYKQMFFNPKYGLVGLVGFPYMLLGEFLEPILELVGYACIGVGLYFEFFTLGMLIKIFLLTWGTTLVLTCISILLELTTFRRYTKPRQFAKLLYFSILESVYLRPIYLIWRCEAIYNHITGRKSW